LPLDKTRARSLGLRTYRGWKLWIEPERLRLRRIIRGWLERVPPGSVVLEVGAGSGFLEPVVRRAVPRAVYVGGDIAPTETTGIVFDATAMPLANASVDVVMAVEVLEHMPQPEALVAEASRVLRPQGRLMLTVPFMFGVHDFRDYHRFTPLGMEQILARHGVALEEVRLRGGTFTAATGLVRTLILNAIVGKPKDWRAVGRSKEARWLASTVVLTPWTVVTWLAFLFDRVLDRDSVAPPGYFFLGRRVEEPGPS
jgi:SAM-dependent methyltransferase